MPESRVQNEIEWVKQTVKICQDRCGAGSPIPLNEQEYTLDKINSEIEMNLGKYRKLLYAPLLPTINMPALYQPTVILIVG